MPVNEQVERMNRTIKDATVRRYPYDSHDQLRRHLQLLVDACNHARRLKTLRGLTPYEFVCQQWTRDPERFTTNPLHHTPGLNRCQVSGYSDVPSSGLQQL
jgi:hypothetical protein